MKRNLQVLIALCVGIVAGVFLGGGPRAQTTAPAYAIIDVGEITDPEAFNQVLAGTPVGLVPFNGRYVIRTDKPVPLEGSPPKRFVVIAFDTIERAQRWSASAPVKEVNALRSKGAKWRAFIVEGLPH